MKRNLMLRWVLPIILFAAASLACGVFNQANQARQTAQAVVTSVQGLATQGSGLVNTAEAFATQNPGMVETARSFTTTQGPALMATAQAFATENPSAAQTAQALITMVPGLLETGIRSTMIAGATSPANPDIPILPANQRSNYTESANFVTYITTASLKDVKDFYLSEMPVYDWLYDPGASTEQQISTILVFNKGDRKAQVVLIPLPGDSGCSVTISTAP